MRPSKAIDDDEGVGRGFPGRSCANGTAAVPDDAGGRMEAFDLRRLIVKTTEPLTAEATGKGLTALVLTADSVPPAVTGDAAGVRAVLAELLGNAVRFTERGEVVASVTARDTGSGRAVVRFEISDTGPGIPAEALDGGSGGLARSRALVERMDGHLDCGTAEGLGSTLSFAVPLDLREQ